MVHATSHSYTSDLSFSPTTRHQRSKAYTTQTKKVSSPAEPAQSIWQRALPSISFPFVPRWADQSILSSPTAFRGPRVQAEPKIWPVPPGPGVALSETLATAIVEKPIATVGSHRHLIPVHRPTRFRFFQAPNETCPWILMMVTRDPLFTRMKLCLPRCLTS